MKSGSQNRDPVETAPRILIVEDECLVAGDLQETLELMGYIVIGIATSGEQAVFMAGETRPDLILMDIKLEGEMDGTQAAELIYDLYKIPIIFLTAYSNSFILDQAKKSSPFGYIVKPFEEKELHPTITMALHKHSLEEKLIGEKKHYESLFRKKQVEVVLRFNPDDKTIDIHREKLERDILDKLTESSEKLNSIFTNQKKSEQFEKTEKSGVEESLPFRKASTEIFSEKYTPKYGMKAASQRTGIECNVIRQYERHGLIKPYRDPDNNYRLFTEDEIEWLGRIKKLLGEMGYNIRGIRTILTLNPCLHLLNCNEEQRENCVIHKTGDYPCWYFESELQCCKDKKCYRCEYYINARQHKKLQC